MPRDDEKKEQRESQNRPDPRNESPGVGSTPNKAEGDEETVDQALRNEPKREMEH